MDSLEHLASLVYLVHQDHLAKMDSLVNQVHLDQPAPMASQDQTDQVVIRANLAQLHSHSPENQVQTESQDQLDRPARLDHLEPTVELEDPATRDHLARLENQVQMDSQEKMDLLDHPDLLERKVFVRNIARSMEAFSSRMARVVRSRTEYLPPSISLIIDIRQHALPASGYAILNFFLIC